MRTYTVLVNGKSNLSAFTVHKAGCQEINRDIPTNLVQQTYELRGENVKEAIYKDLEKETGELGYTMEDYHTCPCC